MRKKHSIYAVLCGLFALSGGRAHNGADTAHTEVPPHGHEYSCVPLGLVLRHLLHIFLPGNYDSL